MEVTVVANNYPSPKTKAMLRQLFLICGLILAASTYMIAQEELEDNSVTVVTNFEARLTEAERVKINPVNPPVDTSRRRQTYNIVDRPLNIDYPAPVIRPRGVSREKAPDVKNAFASLGVGLPGAFYGDLSYDLTGVDNADLGLYANHYSFNNDGNVENQRASDTKFGAQGSYLFDQGFAIAAGASYETRSRYYYGYNFPEMASDSIPSFTDDQVRQRFNTFALQGEIFNGVRTEANFDYNASAAIYLMDANPAVRENGIDITLQATKWISDNSPLDFKLRTDFTSYKDTSSQSLNNSHIAPSYTAAIGNNVRLKVGVNLTSSDDNFNFFPDVSLSAPVIEGQLSAFLGATGDLQKNHLRSLSEYNPWIRTRLRIRNTEFTNIFGGVEGNFSGVEYRLEAGYKIVNNLALYQLDRTREIPQFNVLYDDGNIITFQGTATFPLITNLDLKASVAQRFYSLDNQEKAWHLPSFSLNSSAIYTLPEQNLQFTAAFFLENGLPYQDSEGNAQNLNALADLSLGAEIGLSDNFSAWVQVNNMLNNKRERFVQYPTIGINGLVGVTAKF
jgi:hypothetical protein